MSLWYKVPLRQAQPLFSPSPLDPTYSPRDPASAIITFVTTTIQVVQFAKTTLEEIKDAPEGLKVLQDRIANIEIPLQALRRQDVDQLSLCAEELKGLERLSLRGQKCLEKIRALIGKTTETGKSGEVEVKRLKWLLAGQQRGDLDDKMEGLEKALNSMVNIVVL